MLECLFEYVQLFSAYCTTNEPSKSNALLAKKDIASAEADW